MTKTTVPNHVTYREKRNLLRKNASFAKSRRKDVCTFIPVLFSQSWNSCIFSPHAMVLLVIFLFNTLVCYSAARYHFSLNFHYLKILHVIFSDHIHWHCPPSKLTQQHLLYLSYHFPQCLSPGKEIYAIVPCDHQRMKTGATPGSPESQS